MCHPDLTKGMCCICYGTLRPETTLFEDLYEGRGGVHKGKCAILAGIVPEEHVYESDHLIKRIHSAPPNSPRRRRAERDYYAFVDRIAEVDYYEDGYPE